MTFNQNKMKDKPLSEKVEKCEVDEGGSENNYDWVYWEDVKEAVEKLKEEVRQIVRHSPDQWAMEELIDKIFGDFK